ncbi:hypothetical protein [Notoacmeibacter ruber]|uniref:Uncharacterized protein n=1 Tax=Notoacmeibacter ruber TaxID=2670375 RepID=A0A3L7J9U7_9HYPH|nr:hypothetical protein [Notoacmeibacter ruber]RLQ85272.1 hypothetical protein D8780_15055 [Notoacmeibacter ruber]
MTDFLAGKHTVYIDFSLFYENVAFGYVSGNIELIIIPQIGDSFSFNFTGIELPSDVPNSLFLKVTNRIIPLVDDDIISISLDDAWLSSEKEARYTIEALEKKYNLFGNIYDVSST